MRCAYLEELAVREPHIFDRVQRWQLAVKRLDRGGKGEGDAGPRVVALEVTWHPEANGGELTHRSEWNAHQAHCRRLLLPLRLCLVTIVWLRGCGGIRCTRLSALTIVIEGRVRISTRSIGEPFALATAAIETALRKDMKRDVARQETRGGLDAFGALATASTLSFVDGHSAIALVIEPVVSI